MTMQPFAKFSIAAILVLFAVVLAAPAAATGIVSPSVDGDTLSAKIRLPGGIGADVTLSFEQSVGLSVAAAGLDAELLDAADLSLLQSRLPASLVSVPAAFPVLVTVEPPALGGLSFSGIATLELHTHELAYVPGSPLRLFAAHESGPFEDITASASAGSYRVRGHEGKFSEFLIVADLRPVDSVIQEKFLRIENLLDGFASLVEPTVLTTLEGLLADAKSDWQGGDTVGAITAVESFAQAVEDASGDDIPDVWRSARDLVNAAGELRAAAATLRYSLVLKSNGAS